MNDQLQRYKKMQQELMRQIQVTMQNKALLQNTLKEWQEQLKQGTVDAATYARNIQQFLQGRTANEWNQTYDTHIKKCNQALAYYAGKSNEVENEPEVKGSIWSKLGIVAVALFIFVIFLAFSNSKMTGFFVFGPEKGEVVFEDGYTTEGSRWADIQGSRIYERCLKVTTEADFTAARIVGKVTRAREGEGLTFGLYTNANEEPGKNLGSCTVEEYADVWKSCTIRDLDQKKNTYWICASNPEGEKEKTYYTLAYRIGGDKKTALWTGQNWQKLDHSSYTMKAQFMSEP